MTMQTNQPNTQQDGFTLIELMIVVAIIGILAAVAVPQYKIYVGRAVVSEALATSSIAKTALEEYAQVEGDFPPGTPFVNPQDIGLPANNAWLGSYVTVVSAITAGSLKGFQMTLGNTDFTEINGGQLYFLATANGGNFGKGMTWLCTVGGGSSGINLTASQAKFSKYVPSTCRSN